MLSYRLWSSLSRPPTRNPLFRRAYTHAEEAAPWYVGCVQWAGIWIFIPIIALAGLVYGFGWCVGIAGLLGRERENRTFDLLRLAPPGPLGMSWAAALGYLYHHRTFRNVNTAGHVLMRAMVMALVMGGFGLMLETRGFAYFPSFTSLCLYVLILFIALIADHIQSVVAAVLIGVVAADVTGKTQSAQLYAFAVYSGLQLMTYIVTLVAGYSFSFGYDDIGLISGALVRLALFIGTRELLLWLLWRHLDRRLAPDPYEQWLLLGYTPRK